MEYDIFISYRRSDGRDIARLLYEKFKRNFYVFFDFDALQDGDYGQRIRSAITSAPIFVAILSDKYLSCCDNPDDWVRQELETAKKNGRQIIPINPDGKFGDFSKLESIIGQIQISNVEMGQLFEKCIDDIIEKRVWPHIGLTVVQQKLMKKDFKEARKAAKKAMDLCPDNPDTYYYVSLVNLSGRSEINYELLERASELILRAWKIQAKLKYCYLAYCIGLLYEKRYYKKPYEIMILAENVQRYDYQPELMNMLRYLIEI